MPENKEYQKLYFVTSESGARSAAFPLEYYKYFEPGGGKSQGGGIFVSALSGLMPVECRLGKYPPSCDGTLRVLRKYIYPWREAPLLRNALFFAATLRRRKPRTGGRERKYIPSPRT